MTSFFDLYCFRVLLLRLAIRAVGYDPVLVPPGMSLLGAIPQALNVFPVQFIAEASARFRFSTYQMAGSNDSTGAAFALTQPEGYFAESLRLSLLRKPRILSEPGEFDYIPSPELPTR